MSVFGNSERKLIRVEITQEVMIDPVEWAREFGLDETPAGYEAVLRDVRIYFGVPDQDGEEFYAEQGFADQINTDERVVAFPRGMHSTVDGGTVRGKVSVGRVLTGVLPFRRRPHPDE